MGYAPAGEVLIESGGVTKHEEHIGNAADIPAADILIEGIGVEKHLQHIRNAADIPAADILIEASFVLKHLFHIGNAAGTGRGGVVHSNSVSRPFGIFNAIYCATIANCGIRTANSSSIAMEEKWFSA